jgi:aspartyl aminopeptidase
MNGGVVIKTNAGQKYTSDAITSFIVKKLLELKGGKVQNYEVRNDMYVPSQMISKARKTKALYFRTSGSTVGPELSKLGVKTCDVGCAILSMHSIRETAGAHDVQHAIDLFRSLFENYAELERKIVVD